MVLFWVLTILTYIKLKGGDRVKIKHKRQIIKWKNIKGIENRLLVLNITWLAIKPSKIIIGKAKNIKPAKILGGEGNSKIRVDSISWAFSYAVLFFGRVYVFICVCCTHTYVYRSKWRSEGNLRCFSLGTTARFWDRVSHRPWICRVHWAGWSSDPQGSVHLPLSAPILQFSLIFYVFLDWKEVFLCIS